MFFVLGNLGLWLLAGFAFYATGRAVARSTGLTAVTNTERIGLYLSIGMGTYAVTLTASGFLGLYRPVLAYALLAIGLATTAVKPRELLREITGTARTVFWTFSDIKRPAGLIAVTSASFLTVLWALVAMKPELMFDVPSYHLTLPKLYILAGNLYYVPDIRASSFPQFQEQLNLLGMLLFSDRLAGLFVILMWLSLISLIYAICRRLFGRNEALYSTVVFIFTPVVFGFMPICINDHWWALFFAASCFLLIRSYENLSRRYLVAAAAMAGLAFGGKILNGLLIPLYLLFAFVIFSHWKISFVKKIFYLFIFIYIFLLIASPWFIRNYAATGDFLGFISNDYENVAVWRAEEMPSDLFSRFFWFISLANFRGPGNSIKDILVLPFLIIFSRTSWAMCNGIGVMFYPGLLLLIFARKHRYKTVLLISTILIYYIIWVYLMKTTTPRYLYPLLPILSVASGCGFANVMTSTNRYKKFSGVALFYLLLASNLFLLKNEILRDFATLPLALSPGDHYQYVLDEMYGGEDLPAALDDLPAGSKVLTTDYKNYYLVGRETPVYLAYPWNSYYFDYKTAKDPPELLRRTTGRGFSHVLAKTGGKLFFFPGSLYGGDPRYEQYHFLYDFLEIYGISVGGEDGDGVFGPDRLYELHNEPVRPPRPATERVGEGFDYALKWTPEAFKADGG
jgi:hypothetical protein